MAHESAKGFNKKGGSKKRTAQQKRNTDSLGPNSILAKERPKRGPKKKK